VSKVPEAKNQERQITDEEIVRALEQNTQWPGSPQKMWTAIEGKLQPVPWYKQRRSWMPALAAAMILILILVTQGQPPQPLQPPVPDTGQAEVMQFRTMSTLEKAAGPVIIRIGLKDTAAAGSQLNLELNLTAAEEITFTAETPIIRVMRTDSSGLFTIVTELSVDSWNGRELADTKPLSGTISLTAPHEPGTYLVEVNISGTIDGQPVFFGETRSFTVLDNPKEE